MQDRPLPARHTALTLRTPDIRPPRMPHAQPLPTPLAPHNHHAARPNHLALHPRLGLAPSAQRPQRLPQHRRGNLRQTPRPRPARLCPRPAPPRRPPCRRPMCRPRRSRRMRRTLRPRRRLPRHIIFPPLVRVSQHFPRLVDPQHLPMRPAPIRVCRKRLPVIRPPNLLQRSIHRHAQNRIVINRHPSS